MDADNGPTGNEFTGELNWVQFEAINDKSARWTFPFLLAFKVRS